MSERSIAEVIGWEIVDNPWYETRGYPEERTRIKANGEYWNMSKRPTVDDLLAWLAEREGCIEMHYCTDGVRVPFGWGSIWGDTLLEALEAAVRAVDERTE